MIGWLICALGVVFVTGWSHAVSRRTSYDSTSSNDGYDILQPLPTGRRLKRNMSWLLAAVMSVCEEDPRKCRVSGRGRQRLRGADGEFVVIDASDLSSLTDSDLGLKRSAADGHSVKLDTIPIFNRQ